MGASNASNASPGDQHVRGHSVTYGVLAAILCTSATLLLWVLSQHQAAGHDRHDQQTASVVTKESFEAHVSAENLKDALMRDAVGRVERKMDWLLTQARIDFPPDAPPVDGGIKMETGASSAGTHPAHRAPKR